MTTSRAFHGCLLLFLCICLMATPAAGQRPYDLTADVGAMEVRVDDVPLQLSKREFELTEQFLRRSGKVIPRALIEDAVFGLYDDPTPNSVDVLVHRLRKKLSDAKARVVIHTVRGVGYMMTPKDEQTGEHGPG